MRRLVALLLALAVAMTAAAQADGGDSSAVSTPNVRAEKIATVRGFWLALGVRAIDRRVQTDHAELRAGYYLSLSNRLLAAPDFGYDSEYDVGSIGGSLLYQISSTLYLRGGVDIYQFAVDVGDGAVASNNSGAIRAGAVALLGTAPLWRSVYGAIAIEFINGVGIAVDASENVEAEVRRNNTGSTLGLYFVGYFK